MKISEPTGIFIMHEDQLSPEILRAQRMQELIDIKKYRQQKLAKYIRWSKLSQEEREKFDPSFQEGYGVNLTSGGTLAEEVEAAKALVAKEAMEYAKLYDLLDTEKTISIRPIFKPITKRLSIWRRLINFIKGFLNE